MNQTTSLHSLGIGIATRNSRDEIIEVYYPLVLREPRSELVEALRTCCAYPGGNVLSIISEAQLTALLSSPVVAADKSLSALLRQLNDSTQDVCAMFISEDIAPTSVAEVYLKLHLLSHLLRKPHSLNFTGAFGVLQTVAWTHPGAIDLAYLPARQFPALLNC